MKGKVLFGLVLMWQGILLAGEAMKPHQPVLDLIDIVSSNHIEAPAPQQMALEAANIYLKVSGNSPDPGLQRKVWKLSSLSEVDTFLMGVETTAPEKPATSRGTWLTVLNLLAKKVPGASLQQKKIARVNESLKSNRYVGIGIVLHKGDNGYTKLGRVAPGGAASKSGTRKGDHIISIDGVDTNGWNVHKVVDRLRGDRGSQLEVEFLSKNGETHQRVLIRDVVPFKSVFSQTVIEGKYRFQKIYIQEIKSSTVSELRSIEKNLSTENCDGVIIDFRSAGGGRAHDTVLLANALMDGGTIGSIRTAQGSQEIEAEPGRLFADYPIAVLEDSGADSSAWLAAALERETDAVVFSPVAGNPTTTGFFEIPNSDWSVSIPVASLAGPEGSRLEPNINLSDFDKLVIDKGANQNGPQVDVMDQAVKKLITRVKK